MNRLDSKRRAQIISALVEGNSLRGTARMTGVARMTIEKLLRDLGTICARYQDEHMRNLGCRRIECDEIWSFVLCKQKNVPADKAGHFGIGDVWTWVAIDPESKLIPSWRIGPRDLGTAYDFMHDLSERLSNRIQLTTDGHRPYLEAVESAFGLDVDYAVLQKIYGNDPDAEKRYSPAKCIGCETKIVNGDPDPAHISTSIIERSNLSMRMSIKRFARLTIAHSKKLEMHAHSVALHFFHYNFIKIHQSVKMTPAMAAGVTDRLWEISDLVALLEGAEKSN